MPHAVISVLNPAGRQLARVSSHKDGSYAVYIPEHGSVTLLGSAPGHQPQIASLTVDGEPVSHDLVLLAGPGGLVGIVRAADGNPVAGARVVVTDWWGEITAVATTTVDGGYQIEGLVPDRYTVTVTAPGSPPGERSGNRQRREPQPFRSFFPTCLRNTASPSWTPHPAVLTPCSSIVDGQ
jgi:hypothetical protein